MGIAETYPMNNNKLAIPLGLGSVRATCLSSMQPMLLLVPYGRAGSSLSSIPMSGYLRKSPRMFQTYPGKELRSTKSLATAAASNSHFSREPVIFSLFYYSNHLFEPMPLPSKTRKILRTFRVFIMKPIGRSDNGMERSECQKTDQVQIS